MKCCNCATERPTLICPGCGEWGWECLCPNPKGGLLCPDCDDMAEYEGGHP